MTNSEFEAGGSEITCEPLVLWITVISSALLIITLTLTIVVFIFVTIKLSKDKANMKQVINTLPPEQDARETERELATSLGAYENIDIYEASDMNINENAAYSIRTN